MRVRVTYILAALSVLALAAPAWATRLATDVSLTQPAKVQGALLQPGKYRIVASDEDNRVVFMRDKKVVAEFPARWIHLEQKAKYSALVRNQDEIQEIYFSGQTMAIDLRQQASASN